jgi:hypothetical protein
VPPVLRVVPGRATTIAAIISPPQARAPRAWAHEEQLRCKVRAAAAVRVFRARVLGVREALAGPSVQANDAVEPADTGRPARPDGDAGGGQARVKEAHGGKGGEGAQDGVEDFAGCAGVGPGAVRVEEGLEAEARGGEEAESRVRVACQRACSVPQESVPGSINL